MTRLERTAERRAFTVGPLKRISWGAIFGGAILSVALMTLLGALGVAVGAMSFAPSSAEMSMSTLGIAAGIWWLVSGLLAIFAGALVAGRLAGFSRRWEGPLHGVITWSLTTVATLALTTSIVASMGQGERGLAAMRAMEAGEMEVSELAAQSNLPEAVWRDIQREATQTLRLSVRDMTLKSASPMGRTPQETTMMSDTFAAATDELDTAIAGLYRGAKTAISDSDKMAVVDVLVARTNIDRPDAQRQVERWATQLENAWTMAKQGLGSASEEMRRMRPGMTADVAAGVSGAAWLTFFYLLLSAIAAGIGGMLGAPNHRLRKAQEPRKPESPIIVE